MIKDKNLFFQRYFYKIIYSMFLTFFAYKMLFFSSGMLEKIISYFTYPIIKVQGKLQESIEGFKQKNELVDNLVKQVNEITKEKEDLLYENVRLKSSLHYLEEISNLLEFNKKYQINNAITAQVMMKNLNDQSHYCIIDKGSSDSIEKDMIAIYKNCLIGRVIQVYPTYSKVLYITDKFCKVAAYCFKTGAVGIHQGNNNLNFSNLNFVNHLQNLVENDLVISSGEGLIFPQGFALGKILKFNKNDVQYNVEVKPILDFNKINYCQLIKK